MDITIRQARTHLSRLIRRVMDGEEIVIMRSGRPVARLVPFTNPTKPRSLGSAKGDFVITEGFERPLDNAVIAEFEK